jgi:drug/metabolite transporter (DMT)-like permease
MREVNYFASSIWMLGAILAFSLTALAGREATHHLNPDPLSISQLVFFRNLVGLAVVCLFVFWRYRGSLWQLKNAALKTHLARNCAHFLGQWCWFYGLALLPLAQVFAIEFTVPIWTAIFATWLLAERLTVQRLFAISIGFLGVLVILRPGFEIIPLAAWVVLIGALAYALSHTLTKRLAGQVPVLVILFYMHVIQLPLAMLFVSFDFAWPQGINWLFVVITSLAAIAAHFCMAKALSTGEAMLVMPMDFLRLPLIALIGAAFYNEVVDIWLLVGAVIMLMGNLMGLMPNREVGSLIKRVKGVVDRKIQQKN